MPIFWNKAPIFWNKKHWLIPAEKDVLKSLTQYQGRKVKIHSDADYKGRTIEVDTMVGSLTYPNKFEITPTEATALKDKNGSRINALISMLDFFNQMGDGSIPREQIEEWDETLYEVKQVPGGNRIWRPGSRTLR